MNVPLLWHALLVGLGGFVGSVARFLLTNAVYRVVPPAVFPYGTLVVNVTGCLPIGFLGGLGEGRVALTQSSRVFVLIGILGGFTTYSTFAYETIGLAEVSDVGKAAVNVMAHLTLGLGAAWVGYASTLSTGSTGRRGRGAHGAPRRNGAGRRGPASDGGGPGRSPV